MQSFTTDKVFSCSIKFLHGSFENYFSPNIGGATLLTPCICRLARVLNIDQHTVFIIYLSTLPKTVPSDNLLL